MQYRVDDVSFKLSNGFSRTLRIMLARRAEFRPEGEEEKRDTVTDHHAPPGHSRPWLLLQRPRCITQTLFSGPTKPTTHSIPIYTRTETPSKRANELEDIPSHPSQFSIRHLCRDHAGAPSPRAHVHRRATSGPEPARGNTRTRTDHRAGSRRVSRAGPLPPRASYPKHTAHISNLTASSDRQRRTNYESLRSPYR